MTTKKLGIGCFGTRAHQVHGKLVDHDRAYLAAVAAFDKPIPEKIEQQSEIPRYDTLEELLADDRVEVVSLCSPVRREQAAQAITCLEAGRHVFAEKPCAMTEEDLDAVLEAAEKTGRIFREQAGTAFSQPFLAMRRVVQEGRLGSIVQVLVQKSYRYFDRRPQDENVDGGLTMQVGIHALRAVEHVACQRIEKIEAIETKLGNPKSGDLRMAVSLLMQLEGGGVASIIANYLNPAGFPNSSNAHLRIFGTNGFVESVNLDAPNAVNNAKEEERTRLVVGDEDLGPLDLSEPSLNYFNRFIEFVQDGTEMPLSLEEELHPTRMIIRAKRGARLS